MRIKLAAFDMDGVLTVDRSSWEFVHRWLGVDNSESLAMFRKGMISYGEFLRRDVRKWLEKRPEMTGKELLEILGHVNTARNLAGSIGKLTSQGITCAIISGGLYPLARIIGDKCGISIVKANDIVLDGDGHLTENGIIMVDPLRKDVVLSNIQRELNIDRNSTVSVGDSPEDGRMFSLSLRSVFILHNNSVPPSSATVTLPPGDLEPVAQRIIGWTLE